MKVLVKKSFNFVGEIWRAYVQSRINELRYDIVASTIITNPFHFRTCSEIEEDQSL